MAVALCAARVAAAQDSAYLAELQQQAQATKLADDPQWRNLLHFEDRPLGKPRSSVVSAWFFVAPTGRDDADAELQATLAAFFDPAERAPRDEPAQCLYAARYAWLAQRLNFDPQRLPVQDCPRRQTWLDGIAPETIWVVFPSAYLNSPASMFGHTLLRLDGPEVERGTPLLAYAVNFAANTAETNGLVFALKGLTGGYRGQFSVLPYYEKVKEYARLESRDLWEYPLALDAQQRRMLLLHLWELRGAEFTYYFFTRNCSYELLTLLRVAQPALSWGDAYDWRAIPADTLRTLAPLASAAPSFRPSLATQLATQAAQLGERRRQLAVQLADGKLEVNDAALQALSAEERAGVLSFANDVLYYRFVSGAVPRAQALPRSQLLLSVRAADGVRASFNAPQVPSQSPDRGHATRRLAIGAEAAEGTSALTLRLRPAYHDLLDDPGGYGAGQQISFADLHARWDLQRGSFNWTALDLIDIVSVAPRAVPFTPVSWRVRLAAERAGFGSGKAGAVLEGGPGLSFGHFTGVVAYAFLQTRLDFNAQYRDGQSLGMGPLFGVLAQPTAHWQMQMELAVLPSVGGAQLDRRWARLGQQWAISENLALRLEAGVTRVRDDTRSEAVLSLQRYF